MPVFALCAFFVFGWSIIWFFQKLPNWLPYLKVSDLAMILAYSQGFALVESIAVFLPLLGLAAILPRRWFAAQFVARAGVLVLALALWTVLFQLIFEAVIINWTAPEFVVWFGLALLSIALAYVLVHRSDRTARALVGLAERMTVFVYIYVPLGIIGLLVILVRNLF